MGSGLYLSGDTNFIPHPASFTLCRDRKGAKVQRKDIIRGVRGWGVGFRGDVLRRRVDGIVEQAGVLNHQGGMGPSHAGGNAKDHKEP